MALGNSWTTIASGSQTINGATLTYYIDAYLSSQSIANNQSVCPTRARTVFSGYYMQSYGYNFTATGCGSKSGSGLYNFKTETVLTGSVTVNHNADGTGTLSVSGVCQGSGLGLNISVSGSVALPTIPRASKPTVSSNPLTIGNTQVISTNRASTSFTHTVVISVGNYSQTYTDVGASVSWEAITATMMPYMDSWQKTVTITCTTYSGSTQIGSTQSTTFTLQVDTSLYKPNITIGTLTDSNATTAALVSNGRFIKEHSQLSVPVSATVNDTTYGDKIASITARLGSVSQTTTVDSESGSMTFNAAVHADAQLIVTATDSRGYTVTQTATLTLIDYSNISVVSVSYVRVNANNIESETGEKIRYTIVANAYLGSFGNATNEITVKSQSKAASASSYDPIVTEQTVTTSGSGMGQITITAVGVGTYNPSSQSDVIFELTDALSTVRATFIRIHEGVPVYSWGEDHFDVFGEFHIHDREDITKYSTFSYKGYDWHLAGTANGATAINFDSTVCTEIMVVAKYYENANNNWIATAIIPVDELVAEGLVVMMPARIYSQAQYDKGCLVRISTTSANLDEWYSNRTSIISNASLAVYYR